MTILKKFWKAKKVLIKFLKLLNDAENVAVVVIANVAVVVLLLIKLLAQIFAIPTAYWENTVSKAQKRLINGDTTSKMLLPLLQLLFLMLIKL